MSSTNKTENYQLSQFVGTDIPSILNDYNGDMRKIDSAIKDASIAGGNNATAIAELQASTGRMSTEIGGINSTVNNLSGKVVEIEEVIPATASADNPLITAFEIPEIPSIAEIEAVIPSNASASNKLVTENDLGHSIVYNSDRDSNFPTNDTIRNMLHYLITNVLNEYSGIELEFMKFFMLITTTTGTVTYGVFRPNNAPSGDLSLITLQDSASEVTFMNAYFNRQASNCRFTKSDVGDISTQIISNGTKVQIMK